MARMVIESWTTRGGKQVAEQWRQEDNKRKETIMQLIKDIDKEMTPDKIAELSKALCLPNLSEMSPKAKLPIKRPK